MDRPESLGEKMLRGSMRELVIAQKYVFEKAIILYAKFLPDMVREPTDEPNTVRFFDACDEFFRHMVNPSKLDILRAILKIVKSERKHDPNWQQWGDWFIDELNRRGWQPLPEGQPSGFWEK